MPIMIMRSSLFLSVMTTLAQIRVSTMQIAAVYSTTLEKSAVEFAAAYINQQSGVDPLYQLTILNASTIPNNDMATRNVGYGTMSNASGVIVSRLTQSMHKKIQDIICSTHLPTVVAQNTLINITTSNDIVIWRNIANELLNVIHSLLAHVRPAVVVLIESTENVEVSLTSVLPSKLVLSDNATVDVIIVQYSASDNLTHKIKNAKISADFVINTNSKINTSCGQKQSQMGSVFILNSPVHDANRILTMVNPTGAEYRWLLLPHITSYLDDVITTSDHELLWPFSTIVEGIQVDSLSTQEYANFQYHWSSANKTIFPGSSFDTTEFAYDVYRAVVTLIDNINAPNCNQTTLICSSSHQENTTDRHNTTFVSLPLESNDTSHRNYSIWNITTTGLVKFGRWTSHSGFEAISDICQELQSRTEYLQPMKMNFQNNYSGLYFNIVTIQETPFVMRNPVTGKLEGFCIDILEELSKMMGFTYTLYEVADGSFGTQVDNVWNGIVGDIIQERANLSVASLTISSDRITSVDFTKPFLQLGTSILLYKEPEEGFSQTRFARPFSINLIIVFVMSWLIVGTVAWVTAWLSPYDRRVLKREKKIDASYGFSYSMWAQYGSMMQQGSEYHPLSFASRTIVVVWWFVVLVLISSYTAQLAASLTTEGISRKINSITDLTNQDYVQYGTVRNSEVEEFFSSSNITTYKSALPTVRNNLHHTVDKAVEKVCRSRGTFAFIWDSIVIQSLIAVTEDCGLCSTGHGALFNRKGYGIALPFNSSYTSDFTIAILTLRESQFLLTLKNKWIPASDGNTCEDFSKLSYNLTDIGDAFVILAICLVLSFGILVVEILWKYYKIDKKIKGRVMKWKGQIRKWIRLFSISKSVTPSNDAITVLVNGVTLSSLANGQLPVNASNIFIKHKQSLQESA